MPLATSNRTAIRYVKEVTFGTTPASPALSEIRYTGESLNYNVNYIKSNEIRSDRNTTDLVAVGSETSGDINFNLSATSFDDFLEAAMCTTWSTNVLKNGTTTSSFTIQKHIQDATTPFYTNFTGCRIGGFDLNLQTGQIVSGKFSVMGLGAANTTTQFATPTFPAVSTTANMNAVSNVTSIKEDTVTSTNFFSKLSLSVNNNLRGQKAIANLPNIGIGLGSLDVTGALDLYVQDKTMADRYLAGTLFSLEFVITDAAAKSLAFFIPKAKFESGTMVSGGLDQDVMLSGTIRAIYDSTTVCTLRITRVP